MAVVARVLLDHVHQHPPQRDAPLPIPGGVRAAECPALTLAELPLTTARERLTRSAHRARSSSPESPAALRHSQSGSACQSMLAHGSGAGWPPATSVNQ